MQGNDLSCYQWLLGKEVELEKVHIFLHLVFTEEFFIDARTRSVKGSNTSFKRINCFFDIFGNYVCQLNFTITFWGNNSKYQNNLPMLIFANFPCWVAVGWEWMLGFSRKILIVPKMRKMDHFWVQNHLFYSQTVVDYR